MRNVFFILLTILVTAPTFADLKMVQLRAEKQVDGKFLFFRDEHYFTDDGKLKGFDKGGDLLQPFSLKEVRQAVRGNELLLNLLTKLDGDIEIEKPISLIVDSAPVVNLLVRVLMARLIPLEREKHLWAFRCAGEPKVSDEVLVARRIDFAVGLPIICNE
jgi:hypothetical protein